MAARVRRPGLDAARAGGAAGADRHRGRARSTTTASARSSTSSSAACSRPSSTRTPTACASAWSTSATASRQQIVCGAPNVAAGQTVAVARPGAVMPDGTKLGKAKLRGVESNGMILAEDELAIGTEHAGIMVLDGRARAGHAARRACCRSPPTCSSSRSRRTGPTASASTASRARSTPRPARRSRRRRGREDPGTTGRRSPGVEITVECPDLCPRFTARVFEDVTIGPSPPWLKARLMAAGQRPISNVVDITNYVMLLTGQPLHAFDLDRVAGGALVVRRAHATASRSTTLDGADAHARRRHGRDRRRRRADVDRRRDGRRALRGRSDGTTRVLMEVANWDGANIQRTSTRLGLRSEASGALREGARARAGARGAGRRDAADRRALRRAPRARARSTSAAPGRRRAPIRLRDARVDGLLGAPIARERSARDPARRSASASRDADDGLDVTVPAFRRSDVTREADLIEEVARIDGVDKLPATLPSRHGAVGRLTPRQRLRRRAADALAGRGLHEVVGWSFADPTSPTDCGCRPTTRAARVALENPMSEDAVAAAHDAARLAARRRAAQPRARRRRRRALRVGRRLPARPSRAAAAATSPTRSACC